ncbi:9411_t:CDS:2 [Dentiscutata erythropus]|uniref:Fucosyltransferase n=1 Tax=Dentiscutata erythropus TaxID=1348616 RepID=A0A9N9GC89_9GLOM|nr:9411_t:CDS:2 [Dentiscutata erythropus]
MVWSNGMHRLKYNHDGTLMNCDISCIWDMTDLGDLTSEELRTADGLFCVDEPILPEAKSWKGQKFIQLTTEPYVTCPSCINNIERWDFRSTCDENSDVPTSYIRSDPDEWRAKEPFNLENLNKNSTVVSFIASHWTDFREEWVPKLQAHIPVDLLRNTMEHYEDFNAKNCIISKYPFYMAIENSQEKDYSSEKGVVPIIWTAYLEYHQWRTMKVLSEGFERKVYVA